MSLCNWNSSYRYSMVCCSSEGGCGLGGRVGHSLMEGWLVLFLVCPICMPKCPWARHWSLDRGLNREGLCNCTCKCWMLTALQSTSARKTWKVQIKSIIFHHWKSLKIQEKYCKFTSSNVKVNKACKLLQLLTAQLPVMFFSSACDQSQTQGDL